MDGWPYVEIMGWELADGCEWEGAISRLFANSDASHLHLHYAARVDRT